MTNCINLNDVQAMSPKMFQEKLWTLLEKKGVFIELRASLRSHMIKALKWPEIKQIEKSNYTPKYKAINLLIADYLFRQGYYHSLTMFSSEDPTLYSIIDCTNLTKSHCDNSDELYSLFKITKDDVLNVLETLGFLKNSELIIELYNNYTNSILSNSFIVYLFDYFSSFDRSLREKEINKKTEAQNKNYCTVGIQTDCEETFSRNLNIEDMLEAARDEFQEAFDRELEFVKYEEQMKFENRLEIIKTKFEITLKDELNKRETYLKKQIYNRVKVKHQMVSVGCQTDNKLNNFSKYSKQIQTENNFISQNEFNKSVSSKCCNDMKKIQEDNFHLLIHIKKQSDYIKKLLHEHVALSKEVKRANQKLLKYSKLNNKNSKDSIDHSISRRQFHLENRTITTSDNSDVEISNIKKTLQKLEREGEEHYKLYVEFKQRQKEDSMRTIKKSNSYISTNNESVVSSPPSLQFSDLFKQMTEKTVLSNRSDDDTIKVPYIRKKYDLPSKTFNDDTLKNYIKTSYDFSQITDDQPKLPKDTDHQHDIRMKSIKNLKSKGNIFNDYILNSCTDNKIKQMNLLKFLNSTQGIANRRAIARHNSDQFLNKQNAFDAPKMEKSSSETNIHTSVDNDNILEAISRKNREFRNVHFEMKKKELLRRWYSPVKKSSWFQTKKEGTKNVISPKFSSVRRKLNFRNDSKESALFNFSYDYKKANKMNESTEETPVKVVKSDNDNEQTINNRDSFEPVAQDGDDDSVILAPDSSITTPPIEKNIFQDTNSNNTLDEKSDIIPEDKNIIDDVE